MEEQVIDKVEESKDRNKKTEKNNIEIWRVMSYFVIYSFVGFVLETTYGLLTKGVLESRKSFLYGPFCGIYGVGAIIMILAMQPFKKRKYILFIMGCIIGSITEYFVSLFGEMMLHVKWWDYSNEPFNINGRICLIYSIAWGIISVYLLRHFNPKVDRLIDGIMEKIPKYIIPIVFNVLTIFLLLDCVISGFAVNVFHGRLVCEYNLNIKDAYFYKTEYEDLMNSKFWKKVTLKYFSNEKMLKTYPNLKFEDIEGNIIFAKDFLIDIKPYYIKLFTPKENSNFITNVETVNYKGD